MCFDEGNLDTKNLEMVTESGSQECFNFLDTNSTDALCFKLCASQDEQQKITADNEFFGFFIFNDKSFSPF